SPHTPPHTTNLFNTNAGPRTAPADETHCVIATGWGPTVRGEPEKKSRNGDDAAAGDADELVRRETEHRVGMPARRPDRLPLEQGFVDERGERRGMRERRHAADREA